ncbi:MAG: sugar transferase, partial [Pseudomonadota bacterium]
MSTVDLTNRDVQSKSSDHMEDSVALRPKSALSVEFFSTLACLVDAVAIVTAIYAAYRISDVWTPERLPSFATFSALVTVFCLITLVVYRTYRLDVLRAPLTSFAKIYFPFLGAFAVALFVIEATVDPVLLAADWPVSAVLMGMVSLAIGRVAILFLLMNATRNGWIARRVAILGGGEQGRRLIRHIQDDHLKLNRVIGVFDDRTPCKDRIADNLELSGDLNSLVNEVRKGSIDDVILALPWHAEHRLRDLITELEAYAVNVRLSSDLAAFQFPGRMTNDVVSGPPMLTISSNPLSGWRRVIKACEDRTLGTIILVLFAPVMLVVALAIKLESPGPVLFRQKRLGFNNKSFEVFKFRS